MKKLVKVLLLCVLILIVGDIIGMLLPSISAAKRANELATEKVVADVFGKIEAYVTKTHGQWPRSWDDLGLDPDDMGRYIELDFTLDPQKASVEDVAKAIEPINWLPLAVRYPQPVIDRVYLAICQARVKELEPSDAADSR